MEYTKMNMPDAPAKLFMVGIGGIGMSGLAQLLRWEGYSIAGSDRGLQEPGKADMYNALRLQGIRLYEQDGSGVAKEKPDFIIISTAVEDGNPDLIAAAGIPVMHRARTLSQALSKIDAKLVTVAGSCGKTSVTGWISAALSALGESVLMVNGGYSSEDLPEDCPGNFIAPEGKPEWLVVEVDESDKSIAEFSPDYGVLLNVGNDHYSEEELRLVFSAYLSRCKRGAVTSLELEELAGDAKVPVKLFATSETDRKDVIFPKNYEMGKEGITFDVDGFGRIASCQSGRHSSHNASAVLALLNLLALPYSNDQLARSIAAFSGVRQRFEVMGHMASGAVLVNDYAHNPEKVSAALSTAHERFGSPIVAVFQPHGFKPLSFMRAELECALANVLAPEDTMIFLPVFYAGGTASFSITSEQVADELKKLTKATVHAVSRDEAANIIRRQTASKCLLVMGARDSSLRPWTKSFKA